MAKRLVKISEWRNNSLSYILIPILTAVFGEIKIVPFEGEPFRFGLGSIIFFLLILIWSPQSVIRTGIVTGLTVVIFRIFFEFFIIGKGIAISLYNHVPSFIFYVVFSIGLKTIHIEKSKETPLFLAFAAFLIELVSNGCEEMVRNLLSSDLSFHFNEWLWITGVAFFRSFFVVGLYSSFIVSEQKKRVETFLRIGSELYSETLYLQKSMDHIEAITANSFNLQRKLKEKGLSDLSKEALSIAQQIHEVKKDSQRILAGLLKITKREKKEALRLSEIVYLVIKGNKNYSEKLNKNISFSNKLSVEYETNEHIPLLSILNNIVANAVESIQQKGEIHIEVKEDGPYTNFKVKDTGVGIHKEDVPIIFEPGFTTKYSDSGVSATGIGLSHVKEIVQRMGGKIEVDIPDKGAIFHVNIPTETLRKGVN